MEFLEELFEKSDSVQNYTQCYFERLAKVAALADLDSVAKTMELLEKAGAEGRTIFLAANGGSAAVTSHFVNDLVVMNSASKDLPPYRAISLGDNTASITAIANDSEYANIFACQVQALARPGDVLLAMSVSGNSENIIRAIECAKSLGCSTIGWCGFDGGRMAGMCDLCTHFPTTRDEYGPIEDMFSLLTHVVTGYLTMKRGKKLYH